MRVSQCRTSLLRRGDAPLRNGRNGSCAFGRGAHQSKRRATRHGLSPARWLGRKHGRIATSTALRRIRSRGRAYVKNPQIHAEIFSRCPRRLFESSLINSSYARSRRVERSSFTVVVTVHEYKPRIHEWRRANSFIRENSWTVHCQNKTA